VTKKQEKKTPVSINFLHTPYQKREKRKKETKDLGLSKAGNASSLCKSTSARKQKNSLGVLVGCRSPARRFPAIHPCALLLDNYSTIRLPMGVLGLVKVTPEKTVSTW
jgi:hypothetical protein